MTNAQELRTDCQDGGLMQELATSSAVIKSDIKSLRELLVLRFDNIDKNGKRVEAAIVKNAEGVSGNRIDISKNAIITARVATWTTILGTIISLAVALSYFMR